MRPHGDALRTVVAPSSAVVRLYEPSRERIDAKKMRQYSQFLRAIKRFKSILHVP